MPSLRRGLVILALLAGSFSIAGAATAADDAGIPRLVREGATARLLVDGKPFTILGGELHNSSASGVDYMRRIFPTLGKLNLNTVLAPVAWEQLEPEEGRYDFSLVDGLIAQARAQDLHLVVLWFGSWKNGESSYAPGWVKEDTRRFPRIARRYGAKPEVLSPFGGATLEADATAFAALMRHIREVDASRHTVLMVQVENEAGILGDSRDRSPAAEAAFAKSVPSALTGYLQAHQDSLIPELRRAWEAQGCKTGGTWAEVFGGDADEFFMAWATARFIDQVAARGKAEYPLPMYVNAWIIQTGANDVAKELAGFTGGQKAGQYPSGGPVSKVHDIYRAAAPHIDLLAPDIYLPDFKAVVASYTRCGNPLFIPEARNESAAVAKAFYAIGQCGAVGFSPFGIDDVSPGSPLAAGYGVLGQLLPLIDAGEARGKVAGILQDKAGEAAQDIRLGDYMLHVTFDTSKGRPTGYGIVIATGPDEYVIAGAGLGVTFKAATPGPAITRILQIDEGAFENGVWMPGRRLNGDESLDNSRVPLPAGAPAIRKVKLYRYD